jgi:hypothetical protein
MKKIIRTSTKYVINGREYHSLEEMPEQDRQFFLDANKNGIPDGIEKLIADSGGEIVQTQKIEAQKNEVIIDSNGPTNRPDIERLIAGSGEPPISLRRSARETKDPWVVQLNLKTILLWLLLAGVAVLIARFLFGK